MRHSLLHAWWIEVRCRMHLHTGLVTSAILAVAGLLLYLGLRFSSILLDATSEHPVVMYTVAGTDS